MIRIGALSPPEQGDDIDLESPPGTRSKDEMEKLVRMARMTGRSPAVAALHMFWADSTVRWSVLVLVVVISSLLIFWMVGGMRY